MAVPRVAMLGMGKMGSAMALRLREHGHAVAVWNRSPARAELVKAQTLTGACLVGESAAATVRASASDATIILVLMDTAACLETLASLGDTLAGRTVLNLTSGSPDDGRMVAAAVHKQEPSVHAYIDGAYCGPPAKARQGAGVLFLSSDTPAEGGVGMLPPSLIGSSA